MAMARRGAVSDHVQRRGRLLAVRRWRHLPPWYDANPEDRHVDLAPRTVYLPMRSRHGAAFFTALSRMRSARLNCPSQRLAHGLLP